MKYPLKAVAAAVLVSSALFATPAAAAEAPSSGSVLPATYQVQPKSSTDGMSTMGVGEGSKVFWCQMWGFFC